MTCAHRARVQRQFAPIQATARTNVLAALDSARYFALRDALDELLADPPLSAEAGRPAGRVLPGAAGRTCGRTRRRMQRAGHTPQGRPRELAYHEARKGCEAGPVRREAISPALGKRARRFTKQMKKAQSVLGDHQDAVVAGAWTGKSGSARTWPPRTRSSTGCCTTRKISSPPGCGRKRGGPGSALPAPGSAIGPDNGLSGRSGRPRVTRNGGADPGWPPPARHEPGLIG
jgi:hypothetical protein